MVDIPHLFWLYLVMSSLKTFLYDISGRLRMSPASLYERQRELVRHGLLPVREGRGPGSGVPLTAETVATFLIGLLATDSLIDLAEHTAELCSAKPLLVHTSKRTAKRGNTFHSDLANALVGTGEFTGRDKSEDEASALRCVGVQVTRHWRGVLLQNHPVLDKDEDAAEGFKAVEYLVSEEARQEAPALSHTVSIEMEAFWFVCVRLRRALDLLHTYYPPNLFPAMHGTKKPPDAGGK
jgi:hypothetical protein